jgi:predicted dehydrogenase
MILASGVLGVQGRPGANNRIITGHIGVGGKGQTHVKGFAEQIGALCDVDTDQLAKAAKLVERDVPHFTDYRRLLERKDIDAVVISTPGHWHGLITVQACEAGKDVYVEKPAAQTIEEGRAMVAAAQRYSRVVQVGSQGRNHPGGRALRDFIKAGELGKINRIECWHNDNPIGGDPLKMGPPPANLDWDLWLGPARGLPYNPDYCHRTFRWMFDLGGGQIYDRGAHVFSLISWCLDLDRTGPVRVTATGDHPPSGLWDCPINFEVTYEFENPALTLVWSQKMAPPADFDFGAVYHGEKGQTIARGGDGRVWPGPEVEAFAAARNQPFALPKGVKTDDLHRANWLDCIRTREMPLMDIESGHRVASLCILANLAYRLERPLEWNAKTERIVNDESANHLLGSPGRGIYHL